MVNIFICILSNKKNKRSYQKKEHPVLDTKMGIITGVYKLKDPLELRKQDNFQIRVDCKFYWKTKIYNLEWII